jgi:DNA-binding NtrC family response regulator
MKLICIIDDDPSHRKMLEVNLIGQNYEVRSFETGASFMDANLSAPPFAIILDHHLREEKTGLDYLKDIKKKMPKVPVVYMTSESDPDLIKEINASKAIGYIAKDIASLVRLRALLDGISAEDKGSWFSKIFK